MRATIHSLTSKSITAVALNRSITYLVGSSEKNREREREEERRTALILRLCLHGPKGG